MDQRDLLMRGLAQTRGGQNASQIVDGLQRRKRGGFAFSANGSRAYVWDTAWRKITAEPFDGQGRLNGQVDVVATARELHEVAAWVE